MATPFTTRRRRIKTANITHVSLCKQGMNALPTIYKSLSSTSDGKIEFGTTVGKMSDEGLITAIVYAPDKVDFEGDFADQEVIKQIAHDFMKGKGGVDIDHSFEDLSPDSAHIAESFIVQKGDPRFVDFKDVEGNPVDATGAWAVVIKVNCPELRRLYREGKWGGVSMGGNAVYQTLQKSEESRFFDLVKNMFKQFNQEGHEARNTEPTHKESNMTEEQIRKIAADAAVAALKAENDRKEAEVAAKAKAKAEAEAEAQASAAKSKADAEDDVKFEGDPTNVKDVEKHLKKLEAAAAAKAVDWKDPKSVAEYLKTQKSKMEDEGEEEDDDETEEVKALKARLETLQASSNQRYSSPNTQKGKDNSEEKATLENMTKHFKGLQNQQ